MERPAVMPELQDWINARVASQRDELRGQFQSNDPFPHIVIEDFLAPEFCRELLEQFPAFDPDQALNEYGEVGGKAVHNNVRELGSAYRHFDELVRSEPFLELLGHITHIPDLVYDPDYFGGGTHDNRNGQSLDAHIDFNYHPKTARHRRLNMIVFLNPEWQPEWGGSLKLQTNPWQPPEQVRSVEVLPLANRCVLFETSEKSWHGFERIRIPPEKVDQGISRRSLSVYYYTDERPAEETAPEHSTVYAPPPLPPYLEAGRPLSAAEVDEIRSLVSRRDKQIQFLYEREKEIAQGTEMIHELRRMIVKIERSPSFRLGRALTWPLRKLAGR